MDPILRSSKTPGTVYCGAVTALDFTTNGRVVFVGGVICWGLALFSRGNRRVCVLCGGCRLRSPVVGVLCVDGSAPGFHRPLKSWCHSSCGSFRCVVKVVRLRPHAVVVTPGFRCAAHGVLAFGQKRLCSVEIEHVEDDVRFKRESLSEATPRADWIWDVADVTCLYPEEGARTFAIITAKNIVEFVKVLPGRLLSEAATIAVRRCQVHCVVFCASIAVKDGGVWVASGAVTNDVSCFKVGCCEGSYLSPPLC
jgi:hypothetical protein